MRCCVKVKTRTYVHLLNGTSLLNLVLYSCSGLRNRRGLEISRQQLPARNRAALAIAFMYVKAACCRVDAGCKLPAVVPALPRTILHVLLGYAHKGRRDSGHDCDVAGPLELSAFLPDQNGAGDGQC